MDVILYTTHCPKCNVLSQKLEKKKITFSCVQDIDVILEKGFKTVPVLVVDNKAMEFLEANSWINSIGE